MPPWSWVFGHLLYIRSATVGYPSDVFAPVVMPEICKEFSDTDMFYLDLWPCTASFLMINDPNPAMQVSSGKQAFPKPELYRTQVNPFTGGPSTLTMNGAEWKKWRAIFNPAFSLSRLMEQVPDIVKGVDIFCQRLSEKVEKNAAFQLEDLLSKLTMSIIIKFAMWAPQNCLLKVWKH
jgi:cytochrome P450